MLQQPLFVHQAWTMLLEQCCSRLLLEQRCSAVITTLFGHCSMNNAEQPDQLYACTRVKIIMLSHVVNNLFTIVQNRLQQCCAARCQQGLLTILFTLVRTMLLTPGAGCIKT
jgi:hypothetical protein